jgi:virginiamycin B lyase
VGNVSNYVPTDIHAGFGITAGPDGALWFTGDYVPDPAKGAIGRITTAGTVSVFTGPGDISNPVDGTIGNPRGITTGSDGALWFTNQNINTVGRITTTGAVSSVPDGSGPTGITGGPDGALWVTANNGSGGISRIHPSGEPACGDIGPDTGTSPTLIAAGSDGALWYTNDQFDSIGRITTCGVVSTFTDPSISQPFGITAGPDGALWFTNSGNNSIGRITTAGKVSNFTGPGISQPLGITAGPDGALWFTNTGNNSIGRIKKNGKDVESFTGPGISQPLGITAGPDGALWFTNLGNGSIGRITTSRSHPNP